MEQKRENPCWLILLAGLLALGLLGWFSSYGSSNNAAAMRSEAATVAEEGLAGSGYSFASTEVQDGLVLVAGEAPDEATAAAACASADTALQARGMLGLPGIIAQVQCNVTFPGGAAVADGAGPEPTPLAEDTTAAGGDTETDPAGADSAAVTSPVVAKSAEACRQDLARSASIQFVKNEDAIQAGQDELDRIAETMKACRDFQVEVGGHTDRRGGDAINVPLSQRRAESVRKYLIEAGVSADQLTARGYGSSQPVAGQPQDTEQQRAVHRRTEFKIIE